MREAIVQGAVAVRANPLRSALGALAIAVAVATIVIVITALDGVRRYAETTTARTFGSDTFLIAQVASPGRVSRRELQEQLARNPPDHAAPKSDSCRATPAEPRHLRAERAGARRRDAQRPPHRRSAPMTGTTSALADIRDLNLVEGRFFRGRRGRSRRAAWR